MNIDFHYGMIFIVARLAGLAPAQAQTVAHACQYVDDATTNGLLHFASGETFERFASAHEMIDYQNVNSDDNRTVWAPFHFLPGGVGGTFEERAVCLQDSAIARDAVRHAIRAADQDNALHRLGVTLHVYIDTWAHKGFSGISSNGNAVHALTSEDMQPDTWLQRLKAKADHIVDAGKTFALTELLPLGHGAALHYPDMPWAKWHYKNGHGDIIQRDNLQDFIDAADMACRAIQAYQLGVEEFERQPGVDVAQKAALVDVISKNRNMDPQRRLDYLSAALTAGAVPGLAEAIPAYISKGAGSWKSLATGIDARDDGDDKPAWTEGFELSDYRKFHDAVKEHRFAVTQRILPAHKLRLA
jgi:hypothetical protein